MAPLAAADNTSTKDFGHKVQDAVDALHQELEKGIRSMKNGEVYTIEKDWEEVDEI